MSFIIFSLKFEIKRTHGHGQQCSDCGVEEKEAIRGENGNGKNTRKREFYFSIKLIPDNLFGHCKSLSFDLYI